MSFANASEVTLREDNKYVGQIQPGWDIFGAANGGYLLSILARAMAQEANGRDLISINGHFTSPGRPGPVTVDVKPVKVGGTLSTLRAELIANTRILIAATATFGSKDRTISSHEMVDSAPPDLPPVAECVLSVPDPSRPLPPPLMSKVQVALHPEDAGFMIGDRTGISRLRGWFNLRDHEEPDPLAVVVAADAFPPAIFNTTLPLGWIPTLDLGVHIRDPGPHGWLKCQFRTRFVKGGLLEEDSEIWDENDRLVAQSRQLALVPR